MAWAIQSDGTFLHGGTGRDCFMASDAFGQLGSLWFRVADKTSNVKGILCSDAGGFSCVEAGIEGANCVLRTVTNGTENSPIASVAHGLGAATPFTMRVDLVGTILKVFLNGVLPAVFTADLSADPVSSALLSQSGYGFVSKVDSGLVLQAFRADLIPNTLPALKVLVFVCNGDIWYATRDQSTGAIRATLAGARALASTQPISSTEFQQKLLLVDGVGGHKVFDATTLSVSDWTRNGITDPFYLVCAHQARVFGVPTTNKQNAYGSAINDFTDYYTGSELPGAAYGISESAMPKIGEPIRSMFAATATTLIFGCSRSFYLNVGDPALGGFDITPISIGIGASGMNCMAMTPGGAVVAHTTDGLCLISGNTLSRISADVLTDFLQVDRPLDTMTISVARDSWRHGCLVFLTPNIPAPAIHVWYDERTGKYTPPILGPSGIVTLGGFWLEDYPDFIGPMAVCDWDGLLVLGGRDGYLRTYSDAQANHDGVTINWRLPVLLATGEDLDHDAIIQECIITRADGSSDFNVVFYGGRSAEEALAGDARTLLIRKQTTGVQTKMLPQVRSPAVVIELSGRNYNTVGILEAVQVVTTPGEWTPFARTPALNTPFGNSLRRGSTQNLGGAQGPGGGGGGGQGGLSGTGGGIGHVDNTIIQGGGVGGTGGGVGHSGGGIGSNGGVSGSGGASGAGAVGSNTPVVTPPYPSEEANPVASPLPTDAFAGGPT